MKQRVYRDYRLINQLRAERLAFHPTLFQVQLLCNQSRHYPEEQAWPAGEIMDVTAVGYAANGPYLKVRVVGMALWVKATDTKRLTKKATASKRADNHR